MRAGCLITSLVVVEIAGMRRWFRSMYRRRVEGWEEPSVFERGREGERGEEGMCDRLGRVMHLAIWVNRETASERRVVCSRKETIPARTKACPPGRE